MPSKEFTTKQKEIVARKLGYDGPMSMFDEFLKSDPSMADRYGLVLDKYMARGGVVSVQMPKKMSEGGFANTNEASNAGKTVQGTNVVLPDNWDQLEGSQKVAFYNEKNITPNQLRAAGVDEQTLKFMSENMGYKVTDPTVKSDATTGQPTVTSVPTVAAAQVTEQTNQTITGSGGAGTAGQATVTSAGTAQQAAAPTATEAKTYEAKATQEDVKAAMADVTAAQGTVSDKAQVEAAQGEVSDKAIAKAATFDDQYKQLVATDATRNVDAEELVTAETQDSAPVIEAAQADKPAAVEAMTREMTAAETVTPVTIEEKDMAQAAAITADGLAEDAKAVAAKLDKFTVDAGTLAAFIEGSVPAQATIQGQLTELMKSFDDGKTPSWAAGAIRAANAAMAARGLGGSSMAGAAIFQAAMESALPIAAQDAQTFATMNLQNLNNRQQVALANAAAQQNVSLANLS